jgi:hypothetical protein
MSSGSAHHSESRGKLSAFSRNVAVRDKHKQNEPKGKEGIKPTIPHLESGARDD